MSGRRRSTIVRSIFAPRLGAILSISLAVCACAEDPAPPAADAPAQQARRADEPDLEPDRGEATHLGVPSAEIHRARAEAAGLERMPPGLRAQALARRRMEPGPSYAALRANADAHALDGVHIEGRVGLVRPAGPRLWIMAVHTRREADAWADPLYVVSAVDPALSEDAIARVDAWVVGARTIGRHTLPLVLAYHVEPVP